jgi:hypothetical protein
MPLVNLRWRRNRDLVQTVLAVHHQRVLRTEERQHLRQGLPQTCNSDARELPASPSWVGQRPEDIEHGAHANLAPRDGCVTHRRVVVRREHEAEAGFVHTPRDPA